MYLNSFIAFVSITNIAKRWLRLVAATELVSNTIPYYLLPCARARSVTKSQRDIQVLYLAVKPLLKGMLNGNDSSLRPQKLCSKISSLRIHSAQMDYVYTYIHRYTLTLTIVKGCIRFCKRISRGKKRHQEKTLEKENGKKKETRRKRKESS